MARTLTLAAIQFTPSDDMQDNIDRVAGFIRDAAAKGADVVLPPELFCGHYFCKTQEEEHFARAMEWTDHPAVRQFSELAAELGVVIPVSIYEKDGPLYFNSIVMIDADGAPLGVYRKSHIPDGPGYQEKFYFRPGDTGFRVWSTMKGRIGVGICWDQWFPEAARAMALMGADALLYPTAIGAEPQDAGLDTAARWRRGMQGHAVANVIPVVAANRVGDEGGQVFYGTSFITDETGEIVTDLGRKEEGVLIASFDLDKIDQARAAWGFFRDRRSDLYDILI
ncbi:MAG: N-carbamoylputrescine amidase [Hyphomonas sp.]|uniref:N-carbamoylputrescine amidase n=1 Tax=Hyphomonas sp. TaxID=87 RepID=UPI0025B9A0AA|nr:N-carbamoylputrescine amidase [Hyphomonas sp.]MBA4338586.1 N-carbamoylputrescine amidase [Hyphomonas sp.]